MSIPDRLVLTPEVLTRVLSEGIEFDYLHGPLRNVGCLVAEQDIDATAAQIEEACKGAWKLRSALRESLAALCSVLSVLPKDQVYGPLNSSIWRPPAQRKYWSCAIAASELASRTLWIVTEDQNIVLPTGFHSWWINDETQSST